MRYLFFGAHPDDADLLFGGSAVQLARRGHTVKFVSVTNGNAGHQSMNPAALAARRYAETQASAALAGLEYQVLTHDDGRLEVTLGNREELIRIIRNFRPDVVIGHRSCDYHADHRAVGQLVQDAAFLVGVPLCCADTPALDYAPVFAYSYDSFTTPRPFRPDAAVALDEVLDTKLAMINCHTSQFYEWLPWIKGDRNFDATHWSDAERRQHLMDGWISRDVAQAELARKTLCEAYGADGEAVKYAELFEISEYSRPIARPDFQRLMRGL